MDNSLKILRNTAVELLAYCILDLFPGTELLEGQATQDGFYYDFILPQNLDEQAIPLIEERLRALVKEERPLKILEMMRENAVQLFQHHKQFHKAELVATYPSNTLQILQMGKFYDCTLFPAFAANSRGAGALKILSIQRRTEENFIITRIAGTAEKDPQALKKYLKLLEGFKVRDHRALSVAMQLSVPLKDGWFWLPKGVHFLDILRNWWQTAVQAQGFGCVKSPGDPEVGPLDYSVSQSFSMQNLPLRLAELAQQGDKEEENSYYGLLDASCCTADILSIFCSSQQVEAELISSLQFINKTLKIFGFEEQWVLVAKRAPKAAGSRADWDQAVTWLTGALEARGLSYVVDPEGVALYGPRLELRIRDALGRFWSLATLGVDWRLPVQRKLRAEENKGNIQESILLRGSLLGSLEKLTALILEHTAGQLPFWLAPEQVRVASIGERYKSRAGEVCAQIVRAGFRACLDDSADKLGYKVHAAEREKVPYMVIVGDQEQKEGVVTIRFCDSKQADQKMTVESFLETLQ